MYAHSMTRYSKAEANNVIKDQLTLVKTYLALFVAHPSKSSKQTVNELLSVASDALLCACNRDLVSPANAQIWTLQIAQASNTLALTPVA